MKNLLSHFKVTAKSAGAAIGGVVIIASAFRFLTKDQAEAITVGMVPILAVLIPQRPGDAG